MTGTITTVDPRGFGFVTGDDGGRYFFHAKAWPKGIFDTLTVGQAVRFEPKAHPFKGPRATDLALLGERKAAA